MSTYAKEKGKKLEKTVANILHDFFFMYNNEYKELYNYANNERLKPERDSSSGTFNDSSGDIKLNLLEKFFPFSIECKFHKDFKDLTLQQLLTKKTKLFKIWKEQVKPTAIRTNKKPLLVFKGNRTEIFVMFDKNDIQINLKNQIVLNNFIICLLNDFLNEFVRYKIL